MSEWYKIITLFIFSSSHHMFNCYSFWTVNRFWPVSRTSKSIFRYLTCVRIFWNVLKKIFIYHQTFNATNCNPICWKSSALLAVASHEQKIIIINKSNVYMVLSYQQKKAKTLETLYCLELFIFQTHSEKENHMICLSVLHTLLTLKWLVRVLFHSKVYNTKV